MHIVKGLSSNEWFKLESPQYSAGALLYFLLTTFFTYFYLEIGFNPMEIADNLKRAERRSRASVRANRRRNTSANGASGLL